MCWFHSTSTSYYLQNHIYTSLPKLVETKVFLLASSVLILVIMQREIQRKTAQVEGLIQDTEYSQHTVKGIVLSSAVA